MSLHGSVTRWVVGHVETSCEVCGDRLRWDRAAPTLTRCRCKALIIHMDGSVSSPHGFSTTESWEPA